MPHRVNAVAPTVSVVMSVFNGARYLEEAVASILRQTFRDFEFIIINDGSTDESGELLERFAATDRRISLIHQENAGLPAALNAGLYRAKGRYIARMDADDVSMATRFEKQVAYLDAHPAVGVLGTQIIRMDPSGAELGNAVKLPITPGLTAWRTLFASNLAHPSVMIRRRVFEDGSGYCGDCKLAQDFELWMRLAPSIAMQSLPDALIKYRVFDRKESRVEGRVESLLLDQMAKLHGTVLGRVPEKAHLMFCLHFSGRLGPVGASQLPIAREKSIYSHFRYVKGLHKGFVLNHFLGRCDMPEITEDLQRKLMFIAYSKQRRNAFIGNLMKFDTPLFGAALLRRIKVLGSRHGEVS